MMASEYRTLFKALAMLSQQVSWAIEDCGASPELTRAVTISSTLTAKLERLAFEADADDNGQDEATKH